MKIIKYFIIISLLVLFGCSKETDKGYMDKAAKEMKDSSVTEAVSSYESLIKEYPKSDLAPEALTRMAAIYQNKMVKTLSEKESFKKAAWRRTTSITPTWRSATGSKMRPDQPACSIR